MASDRVPAGTIEVERHGDVRVLRLLGEHDLATVGSVRDAIEAAAATGDGVVVSLAETQFIDSSVTYAVFKADARLKESGRCMVVHVATESVVRRVLELAGLCDALPCTSSLQTAITQASTGEGEPRWSSE